MLVPQSKTEPSRRPLGIGGGVGHITTVEKNEDTDGVKKKKKNAAQLMHQPGTVTFKTVVKRKTERHKS